MKFKKGDMVLLLRIGNESSAYEAGLRAGAVGTVINPSYLGPQDSAIDILADYLGLTTLVDFRTKFLHRVLCAPEHLRLIPPPEAGRWDWCVWRPPVRLNYKVPTTKEICDEIDRALNAWEEACKDVWRKS